jgi:hypothetical protein
MKSTAERRFKVLRNLPEGEPVLVGTFDDVNEARNRIAAFSEYWPGDYVIVPPKYEHQASGSAARLA